MEQQLHKIKQKIKSSFLSNTLNFAFIILYVNVFQMIFGPENSIVGVIFAIMMSASMVRDMTASPMYHFAVQAFVLVGMAFSAFLVTVLPPPAAFFINLAVIFLILYAYTYEYSNHIYFPYILSYLFLVFISPTDAEGLPKRLLAMAAGVVSIILYQLYMGRKRVVITARDVLSDIIDEAQSAINFALTGQGAPSDLVKLRSKVCVLSRTVYERRKKILCVSDASFSMIDAGRGLEHLIILLHEFARPVSESDKQLMKKISSQLMVFRSFIHQETTALVPVEQKNFILDAKDKTGELFYDTIVYIQDRLLHMTDPQKQGHYRQTALSLKVQLKMALNVSQVRVLYAVKTSLLLASATLIVQLLGLPHGKWLLFTLASVSLPYADDVPGKMKKRTAATIAGGILSVLLYSAISSGSGRTAIMMLSGYVSYYLSGYVGTFSCSTLGALGGAVFVSAFGLQEVGSIFLIRLAYILIGIGIGYVVHCIIRPYRREDATHHLWDRYQATVDLLTKLCHDKKVDPQLYYHLVIQAHLQEDKLSQNAATEGWDHFPQLLSQCREKVRQAHRSHMNDSKKTAEFDARHLNSANTTV